MLCEDEPLPPDTIQHNSTFRAMIEYLFILLEVEIDTQDDWDVGEDLLHFDTVDWGGKKHTNDDIDEINFKETLIQHRAEKNLHKLEKGKDVGDFHVEEGEKHYDTADVEKAGNRLKLIFSGRPVSKRTRDSIRPLNDDEEIAFRWRRLCDAALQEDTLGSSSYPRDIFPLCHVNFDWRCQKWNKWCMALNLLLDTKLMNYGSATSRALIIGAVNYHSYADPSQLPRIKPLQQNIDLLMRVYASSWDPKLLAIDSRRIYAVCTTELFAPDRQRNWVIGFGEECAARGIDIKATGNGKTYQARLEVFRDIKDDFIDGCGSMKSLRLFNKIGHQKRRGLKDWVLKRGDVAGQVNQSISMTVWKRRTCSAVLGAKQYCIAPASAK